MRILKYKKLSNNRYKVFFDQNNDIILYENIILKYNLLIKKELSSEELKLIMQDNNNYMVYDTALKYINIKMRCESEIINYLEKKEIDKRIIIDTINKLKENGFINERLYIKSFISDKINLNNYGPNKIKSELLALNLDKYIIEEEISNYSNDVIKEILEKLIDKKIKSNKNYGESLLKQKIIHELINKGYNKSDIIEILDSKDLSNNDLYEKEYNKLYNKYSKKYSGAKLEYLINQKLYQKGFKKGND